MVKKKYQLGDQLILNISSCEATIYTIAFFLALQNICEPRLKRVILSVMLNVCLFCRWS